MNIFVRELKANLKSLLIWGVIVILFVMVGVSKFSAYYNNPEMLAILDAMPPAMLAAFNLRGLQPDHGQRLFRADVHLLRASRCPLRRPCGAATSSPKKSATKPSSSL